MNVTSPEVVSAGSAVASEDEASVVSTVVAFVAEKNVGVIVGVDSTVVALTVVNTVSF